MRWKRKRVSLVFTWLCDTFIGSARVPSANSCSRISGRKTSNISVEVSCTAWQSSGNVLGISPLEIFQIFSLRGNLPPIIRWEEGWNCEMFWRHSDCPSYWRRQSRTNRKCCAPGEMELEMERKFISCRLRNIQLKRVRYRYSSQSKQTQEEMSEARFKTRVYNRGKTSKNSWK